MKKNTTGQIVCFQAISTTDGSAVTTGTPAVYVTIDGGTQGTGAGAKTHEGYGCWSYACDQADTNGTHVAFTFVLSGAISQTVNVYPIASVDQTGDSYARLGAPAGASIAADLVVIDDFVDGIESSLAAGVAVASIAANAITATAIADDAIAAAKLATGAITADAFAADAIVAATLATGAITADAFAADAIVAATLATGALTADAFAANAITNAAVADDVDVNVKTITAGAITAAAIADAAIDAATFAAGAIDAAAIATGAVDADAIAADAAAEIADAVLSRNVSNVEASAAEHTLCTVVLAMLENSISGTTLTIKRTDGATTHATKTLTTNAAAEPIIAIA